MKGLSIRTVFLVVSVIAGLSAAAQRQRIRFSRLGPDQGLSHSNVTAILQDSRGYVWVGTRDGLNLYDGYKFTIFRSRSGDADAISNSFVTSITEDGNGDLWVGTWGGGVDRYDRARQRFVRCVLPDPGGSSHHADFINCLMKDRQGKLWIGTDGGGLDILDPRTGVCRNFFYDGKAGRGSGLGDNDVTALCQDRSGHVWIGTFSDGVYLYDSGFRQYSHVASDGRSLSENSVASIFEDSHGRLWVGTKGGGLNRLDGRGFLHYRHDAADPSSLPNDAVASIGEDDEGALWIGTENGGLAVMGPHEGRFQTYVHDEVDNTSIGNNSVDCIYKDTQGDMWLGTFSSGINLYNKDANKFFTYRHNSGAGSLGNNNVLFFCEDRAGAIWLGTDGGGLEKMDVATGLITSYLSSPSKPNSMGGNFVLSLLEDRQGQMWAGTWGDGLTILDTRHMRFKRYRHKDGDTSGPGGNNVYAMVQDADGDIWAGCYGSCLDRYRPADGTWKHYRHDAGDPNSLASMRIHTLLAGSDGYLWIGTFDGGLDRLDRRTGEFRHFVHTDDPGSLANNSVNCLYEDGDGYLWVGTANGLSRLDRRTGRFSNYSTADGLPNNMIYGVLQDRKGIFWISTNRGISRFDAGARRFRNYFAADGLQSNEFKAHSCLRSSSGRLYFGGVNGFNEFDPDSVFDRRYQAPVVITSFQLFNKEVAVSTDSQPTVLSRAIGETKALTLDHSSSVISFEFAALDYTVSKTKEYAYMLKGFDTGWNYVGTRRMATYMNLDPGKYVFMVRAVGRAAAATGSAATGSVATGSAATSSAATGSVALDPIASGSVAQIMMTITPPFWRRWWFRVVVVVFAGGLALSIHRFRLRHLRNQKARLEKEVAELLDQAVAQGKFETASDVLHDLGNAVVGFGTYLTRSRKMVESGHLVNLSKLSEFFVARRASVEASFGEEKASAIIAMTQAMVRSETESREEMRKIISEQLATTARVQEILHIQRQYISGKESSERKPVSLRSVVNDSVAMLFGTFDRCGISVEMDMADEQFTIKGDRTRLMQVVLNLLKNSIEAIPEDAAERTIRIGIQREAGQIVLSVRDTGHGFTEEAGAQHFMRGYSTKPSGGGTGLYSSRTIVESHGGSVGLHSDGERMGAVALVRLPG